MESKFQNDLMNFVPYSKHCYVLIKEINEDNYRDKKESQERGKPYEINLLPFVLIDAGSSMNLTDDSENPLYNLFMPIYYENELGLDKGISTEYLQKEINNQQVKEALKNITYYKAQAKLFKKTETYDVIIDFHLKAIGAFNYWFDSLGFSKPKVLIDYLEKERKENEKHEDINALVTELVKKKVKPYLEDTKGSYKNERDDVISKYISFIDETRKEEPLLKDFSKQYSLSYDKVKRLFNDAVFLVILLRELLHKKRNAKGENENFWINVYDAHDKKLVQQQYKLGRKESVRYSDSSNYKNEMPVSRGAKMKIAEKNKEDEEEALPQRLCLLCGVNPVYKDEVCTECKNDFPINHTTKSNLYPKTDSSLDK